MFRRSSGCSRVPIRWQPGVAESFRVVRVRLRNRRWTCVQYATLTRLSALCWERLVRAGCTRRLRVLQAELMVAFGPSLAEMQAYMRRHIRERRNTL